MFQPTMINPVRNVREQVVSSNEESGGIPPLDISQYLSRPELAKIGYLFDNAADAAKPAVLIKAGTMVISAALVMEYKMEPEQVDILVPMVLAKEDAHPSLAFDANTVDHVRDYLQFAYTFVRTEIFTASMERYQAMHKLYVPVDKLDYFPLNELIQHMKNPEQEVTIEEAELTFQRNPMMSFAIMYAMSSHQVYATVPLQEFRSMMLPMSYQLWKQVILVDDEKKAKGADIAEIGGVGKTLKLGLRNQVIGM